MGYALCTSCITSSPLHHSWKVVNEMKGMSSLSQTGNCTESLVYPAAKCKLCTWLWWSNSLLCLRSLDCVGVNVHIGEQLVEHWPSRVHHSVSHGGAHTNTVADNHSQGTKQPATPIAFTQSTTSANQNECYGNNFGICNYHKQLCICCWSYWSAQDAALYCTEWLRQLLHHLFIRLRVNRLPPPYSYVVEWMFGGYAMPLTRRTFPSSVSWTGLIFLTVGQETSTSPDPLGHTPRRRIWEEGRTETGPWHSERKVRENTIALWNCTPYMLKRLPVRLKRDSERLTVP